MNFIVLSICNVRIILLYIIIILLFYFVFTVLFVLLNNINVVYYRCVYIIDVYYYLKLYNI